MNALFLGAPWHLEVHDMDTSRHYWRVAERPWWTKLTVDEVYTLPIEDLRITCVDYSRHLWQWRGGSDLVVYSSINDEYWMGEHVRRIGNNVRHLEWSERRRLADELEEMHREFEAKLMLTDYARQTIRSRLKIMGFPAELLAKL